MILRMFGLGLFIGIFFGVPAGPIGALTIQRTLERGFTAGFITGLGSSASELIYSIIGVFGISAMADIFARFTGVLQLVGAVFIAGIGIMILRKKRLPQKGEVSGGLLTCFLTSFITAMMNPTTLLTLLLVSASLGIEGPLDLADGAALCFGILLGSICWWAALAGITAHFRERVSEKLYLLLNKILGSMMLLFSLLMLIRAVRSW